MYQGCRAGCQFPGRNHNSPTRVKLLVHAIPLISRLSILGFSKSFKYQLRRLFCVKALPFPANLFLPWESMYVPIAEKNQGYKFYLEHSNSNIKHPKFDQTYQLRSGWFLPWCILYVFGQWASQGRTLWQWCCWKVSQVALVKLLQGRGLAKSFACIPRQFGKDTMGNIRLIEKIIRRSWGYGKVI